MSVVETFHGYIETTQDTLLIFEACRRGLLPRICRRLQEKERRIIQSGTVFVFDERESGIKRWTDGLVWSPSRILGNFLVYRELDKHTSGKKNTGPIDRASRASSSDAESAIEKNKERALVGSLTNSYRFKKQGLIKKTMSIVVNGVSQHMISYYSKEDVLAGKLRTPSSVPELASLEISPEFLMKQNFRIPPTVEQSYDHTPAPPPAWVLVVLTFLQATGTIRRPIPLGITSKDITVCPTSERHRSSISISSTIRHIPTALNTARSLQHLDTDTSPVPPAPQKSRPLSLLTFALVLSADGAPASPSSSPSGPTPPAKISSYAHSVLRGCTLSSDSVDVGPQQ
ncbi:hypothetical protein BGZ75_003447 [Mortierella antarctica]|nr:hypothetical protein BGZ75_003447 [Mortierella antarctica]